MDLKTLKVDLDIELPLQTKKHLRHRLAYLHDLGIFPMTHINKIELIYKRTWGCKIYLNKELSENLIVIIQLLLGSDWKKEANTLFNHHVLKQDYSNRLFDLKYYPRGHVKRAEIYDVTSHILSYVKNKKRKKNHV